MFVDEMTKYVGRWNPADVVEVGPLIIEYRPTHQPTPNTLHREMLRPKPGQPGLLRRIFKRGAVVQLGLHESIQVFEASLRDFAEIETGHILGSWQDLLRLNLRHVTGADRHVTNGQATVTRLDLGDGRISVALHGDMELFLSHVSTRPSLIPHRLATRTSDIEARDLALQWLADVKETSIPVRVNGDSRIMTWRTWGWLPGRAGYRRRGLVLSVAEQSVWTELDEWAAAPYEPYAVLNRLGSLLPGVDALTCATCRHFAFSGMSRDMSGGWTGYCRHPDAQPAAGLPPPTVSVVYHCDRYAMVLDSDRDRPFIRRDGGNAKV